MEAPTLAELELLFNRARLSEETHIHALADKAEAWLLALHNITPADKKKLVEEVTGTPVSDKMRTVNLRHLPTAIITYFYGGYKIGGMEVLDNSNGLAFVRCPDYEMAMNHLDKAVGFQSVKAAVLFMQAQNLDLLYFRPDGEKIAALKLYG